MTTLLCILDGWGHSDAPEHNAIAAAHTPTWDALLNTYPHGVLNASEGFVGLPDGQMGNSEVGHMNIGAGRVVMQDLPRINAAIKTGALAKNPELLSFIDTLKQSGGDCHLMGLLSDGGVHSHMKHMLALADVLADAGINVWLHAFLDGRDTPPKSAKDYIETCDAHIRNNANIQWGTICGRYFAMDRDNRWDRVEKAYDALTQAEGKRYTTPQNAITASYGANITDEFVEPAIIEGFKGMQEADGLLMANFRADRAREIIAALLNPAFDGFARKHTVKFAAALGMVEYSGQHNAWLRTMFPPETLTHTIGEVVADAGKTQLRIAETEKYAHVTFFANGGREEPFDKEDRILIPSPDVATYDLQPEMSAPELTDQLVQAIESEKYDFIFVNYANTDMVGHSGNMEAAIKAVEAVDSCLARVMDAIEKTCSNMIISADHGNAECMQDATTANPHTAHTTNLVPVILINAALKNHSDITIREGTLADLAPTALQLMGMTIPTQMTGTPLISAQQEASENAASA